MAENNNVMPSPDQPVIAPDMLKLQQTLEAGKTVIGIDIGVSSVNVAQTALYHGKPTLIKVALENIGPVNERERDKIIVAALKRVLSKFNTKKADIVCVIPSLQTVVESIVMPMMPPEELRDAVKLEVSSSQHFVIDRPVMDFQIVSRVVDKGVEKLNVLVVAAPKTAIDGLLANFIVQQAKPLSGFQRSVYAPLGLNVDAIIPLSVALENIIKKSKLRMDETLAIIEMGTIATELNIYRNAQLEFSRKIPVAGIDLTRSLTSALFASSGKIELSMENAEAIKREFGIPAPGENYLIQGKITAGQILSLLRPKLEQLASEISRSFDYYHENMRAGKVDRIIIFGGGAKLKGLPEFLNAELGTPVDLGNPLQDVELLFDGLLPDQDDAQRLVQAIGASLSDLSGINLIPLPLKEREKRSVERMAVIVSMIVLLGILGLSYFGSMAKMSLARQRASGAVQEYQALLPKLEELKNGLILKKAVRNRPDMGALLKQLSYLPPNVCLTELSFSEGKVSLLGFVSGSGRGSQEAPAQLAAQLRKGILIDANLSPVKKPVPGKAASLFEIQGRMASGGGAQ